jgi:hypothetical protein
VAQVSRPLGGQIISVGSTRSGSLSGNIYRRSQMNGGAQELALGAIVPPARPAAFFPPGANTTVGFTQPNASPSFIRMPYTGAIMQRSQLGGADERR